MVQSNGMMHFSRIRINHPDEDLSFSTSDSAPFLPKSVVIDKVFDWQGDTIIPLHKTVIYELHVKDFTQLAKHIPEALRGTYAGIFTSGIDQLF